ncbi:DUF58 domain-containing protein [Clostridium sp. C2-6-12]|uniref:DUF58 domain-containing protein n=1 Tax=Clostridium sp. C2-6-12 TaxID=2698832 RepID=UPI00136DEFDF|nr:DUF58 domain-containing protein [Clostridium sp. C2-6-12]
MKLNRIMYAVMFIIALIFVYSYGGKVPYMLFYTVLLLPVVSFVHLVTCCFLGKYEQNLNSDSVIKGDRVDFSLRIINRSFFMLPYISIRFWENGAAVNKQSDMKSIALQPFGKRDFNFEYIYKYKGCFKIGISEIEFQDFLGIFKLVRRNKRPLLINVYPRNLHIDSFALNINYSFGDISNFIGIQEDTSIIKEIDKYSYGDSLKKVHWKLTAKSNELMVKKYENYASVSAVYIIDLKNNGFSEEDNAIVEDKHIETAIAVLKRLIHDDVDVKLVYADEKITSIQCRSSLDFEKVYEILAKVKFDQNIKLTDIIYSQTNENISNSNIIISTSNLDFELYETVNKMKLLGYDISLIHISTKEILGKKETDSNHILSLLLELGIKVYNINISDNIKAVFGQVVR